MRRSTNNNVPVARVNARPPQDTFAYSPSPFTDTYQTLYPYDYLFEDDIVEWPLALGHTTTPQSDNFQATQVTRTGSSDSRRPFGRTTARPLGLAGSLAPAGSRIHVLLIGNEREANPRTRQIINSPWDTVTPTVVQADSRLTQNEQKRALQKLKKEIYNPFRRLSQRVNLYYRDTVVKENEIEKFENGKRCAVCLEDFEPRQEVMLTPCNHMFHEECIVPWVKSNGHCPVCRFAICE